MRRSPVAFPYSAPVRKSNTPTTRCRARCSNGSDCCLNGSVPHQLHICSDWRCACHSAARYASYASREKR